ncbi:hypothetical protein PV326_013003, partial [Microctonus aethiopoides]
NEHPSIRWWINIPGARARPREVLPEICMVGTRVYVGGLPYGIKERDLERFFRGYGRFRDVLIKNGYGFVEFDDYRDADDAVYELNGKELLGERYGPPTRTEYRLTVENLSSRVSWQLLPPVFRMDIKMTGRMEILFLAKVINQCGQPNSHTQTMSNTNGGQSKRRWAMQHRLCGKYQGAEHELIQNIRNEYYKKKKQLTEIQRKISMELK